MRPCEQTVEQKADKNREKSEFDMFPYAFVCRKKQAYDIIIARPFVKKVSKTSQYQSKEYTRNGKYLCRFIHKLSDIKIKKPCPV